MDDYQGKERRTESRKGVYTPIKLLSKGEVLATGQVLDINCQGIKSELIFKTVKNKKTVNEILSAQDTRVAIGWGPDPHIKAAIEVRWCRHKESEEEKTYEVGFVLKLSEEQQQDWENFYRSL